MRGRRPTSWRRRAGTATAAAFCLAAALGAGGCGRDDAIRDVLLITVDTLRADRLGYAGHAGARTPHLDSLAAGGTVFTQAITPMPRTTPGLASLMTGLWPQHHGSREVGDPMVAGRTLAEALAARSYFAAAVSANGTAGPEQGLAAGFDRFVTRRDLSDRLGDRLYRDRLVTGNGDVGWAEATTDVALELARQAPPGRPLFLWVFYFDPHFIYRPPAARRSGVEAERCLELYDWGLAEPRRGGQVLIDHQGVASAALDDCGALYDAEIAYADAEIGRLLRGLEGLRDLDDALLVFTSDHGENLGEGGLFYDHGENLHDAGLRVPLVFAGPGVAAGRRDHGAVSLVDVAPTVLSLLGIDAPAMTPDGVDLAPRLRTPADTGRSRRPQAGEIRFAESATAMWNESTRHLTTGRAGGRACIHGPRMSLCRDPGDDALRLYDHVADPLLRDDVADRHPETVAALLEAWRHWPPETARYLSARTPDFKLLRSPALDGGTRDALFDLRGDPAESRDVADRHPDVAAALARALDDWTAPMRRSPERADDQDRLEELRALGYVP